MRILGIETSCDETAIGIVEDGRHLRSNAILSQVDIHARYGGIVPEVASRQHVLSIIPVLQEALRQSRLNLEDMGGIAVTMGPGLVGSLLVGVNFGKGLALACGRPFIGVNHLEGHIYAAWLAAPQDPADDPGFPLLCLIASGGHTDLVLMKGHGDYALLGRTRDDAAGEAFDKAARVLGLGFPGGPEIQRAAQGAQQPEQLPRSWLKDTLDFSFSGLKTALLRRAQERGLPAHGKGDPMTVTALASGFQEAIVEVLVEKTVIAAQRHGARGIVLGGGVAANSLLRQRLQERSPVVTLIPRPDLCTDNGAMIASAAYYHARARERHSMALDVIPDLRLG